MKVAIHIKCLIGCIFLVLLTAASISAAYYQGRRTFRNPQGTLGAITVSLSQEGGKQDIRKILTTVVTIGVLSSVIAFGFSVIVSRKSRRFIQQLITYLDRIAKGDIPDKITEEYKGEFNQIKNNLNLLIDAMHETIQFAEEISVGNLQVEVKERSEHDRLMKALNRIIRRLDTILQETNDLIEAGQDGKLDARGNADAFEGSWRDLVVGMNRVIDAFVAPISKTTEYLDRIAKGDIPEKIREEYKGDFNVIKTNLDMLIETMRGLVQEIHSLSEAVQRGKLGTHGNVEAFAGV